MTSSPMDDEIRGDWSNLKGTEYHLVYAIWLLLCRNAGSVAFYQGNDLLARPIPPPDPKNALSPAIHAQVANEDEWIQLKATRDSWTRSALLSGNLLANFIYNALASEAAGRAWRTRLVTQGEIQREEVEEFVADPGNHKELEEKLKKIIVGVQEHLKQNGGQLVDEQRLRTLALNILRQLAQEEPVSLAELKAQIEAQLAYRYLDPDAARQAGDKLLGALLRDASAGPSAARAYDDGWLDYIAGVPLKSRLPFDTNPVSACDQAVEGISTLPGIQWEASLYAARRRLDSALHHFLQAPETTFVLLGISGIGKSWAVADWTRRGLQGRVRLLIPGIDLSHEHQRALSRLAALRLRSFTSAPISDEDILAKLRAVARIDDKGPLIIVIDDVMPTGDINVFRRDLGQLVAECRRAKAKLVLTCQTHVWEFYRLGQHIPPSEVYSPDPVKPDTERVQSASDQAQDEGQRLHVRSSFILSDLTPEEQEEALSQRLPSGIAEHTAHLLREPAFVPLRRPYLLDLYLEHHKGEIQQATSALAPVDIDVLLDTHLKSLLRRVATSINVDEQDVQEAFEALQHQLWQARPNGLSTAEVEKCLEPYIGSRSGHAVEVFRQAGILTARGPMRFAESPLADRVFARTLNHHYDSGGDILSELRLEDDAGVVSALLRSLAHNNPVALAEALVKHNLQWMGPVAEGLAQCSSQDYRVLAFLTVLTRLREDHVGFEGCDALGHLAAYGHRIKNQTTCSQRAFEWVLQLYLSPRYEDRFRGGKALSVTLDQGLTPFPFCACRQQNRLLVDSEQAIVPWLASGGPRHAHTRNPCPAPGCQTATPG